MKLPHQVHIIWGESKESGQQPVTYNFHTAAEAAAFLKGIEEADGWFGYEQVDTPTVRWCEMCDEAHEPDDHSVEEEDDDEEC